MRIEVGDRAPALDGVIDTSGIPVSLDDSAGKHLLLVFLRYASCPMCLLHVRDLGRRNREFSRAGVGVVVVFHSPAPRIEHHTRRLALPFRVVADPSFALYARYGVGSSWLGLAASVAMPSFYVAFAHAMVSGFWGGAVDGDVARMPADFLIGADGIVRAAHYGRDIGDHLSIDEVLRVVEPITPALRIAATAT